MPSSEEERAARRRAAGTLTHRLGSALLLGWAVFTRAVSAKGLQSPRFTLEPAGTVVVAGSPVVLSCAVDSDKPTKFGWRKDGVLLDTIADERRHLLANGSLLIRTGGHEELARIDSGRYQCEATVHGLGSIISRPAAVTLIGEPRFVSSSLSTLVIQGDSVVLDCGAEVTGLWNEVRWFKEGRSITEDSQVMVLSSGDLLLQNASKADGGKYFCQLVFGGRTFTNQGTNLSVLPEMESNRPCVVLRHPVDVSVRLGHTATLECVVAGFPAPSVHWTRGTDERFSVVAGGILRIDNVQQDDAGDYTCIIKAQNETQRLYAKLTVLEPPRILHGPENRNASVSDDIILECQAEGRPRPVISWFQNGDLIIPDDFIQIVDGSLHVLGVMTSDEGVYQCMAESEVDGMQAAAQLVVINHAVPGILASSAPRGMTAVLVSTRFIRLSWRAPAESRGSVLHYSVYYMRVGSVRERRVDTLQVSELQLVVGELRPETGYSFQVVAVNQAGPGERSAPLRITTQPEVQVPGPVLNLHVVAISTTSVSLQWDPPANVFSPIMHYKLYYMQLDGEATTEHDQDTDGPSFTKEGLRKFTRYSFRVVAYNKHGPGVSSEDTIVRTYSDVPSGSPQELILEVVNSQSVLVRWKPPSLETHNGDITGYKIHYRKAGRRAEAEIEETAHLSYLAVGLDQGSEYSFRVAAVNSNGTGPFSDWLSSETFQADLDESRVPDQPSSLHVRPFPTSIVVSWTPPANPQIMVRGYALGYGIGSPHGKSLRVDSKQRYYTIDNLEPSSQYVISLKAFNHMGEGIPLYESATTRTLSDHMDPSDIDLFHVFADPVTAVPEPPTPMLPPVGVQATVLSHDTIRVAWADNSLPRSQRIPDARHYTVRWKTYYPANTKYKMANSTSLSYLVGGLKPNTLYEFAVMVTKGRRTSTWSMTAHGTTLEMAPTSAPKDLTVVTREGKPRTVLVNWQPPAESNGKITGYMIYYSADVNMQLHDWVVEPVVGDRLSHQVQELTLDTIYYFRMQSRNAKGMGPVSDPVRFHTPKAESPDKMANDQAQGSFSRVFPRRDNRPGDMNQGDRTFGGGQINGSRPSNVDNTTLVVIIVCVGVITIIVIVLVAIICNRRMAAEHKKRAAACSSKRKSHALDLSPPDLWIHHERLEMRTLVKSASGAESGVTETPVSRHSQEIHTIEPCTIDSLTRRNSYIVHEGEDCATLSSRRSMRSNVMIPLDSQQSVQSAPCHHTMDHTHHLSNCILPSPGSPQVLGHLDLTYTGQRGIGTITAADTVHTTPSVEEAPIGPSAVERDATHEEEICRSMSVGHMRPSQTFSSFATLSTPTSPLDSSTAPLLPQSGTAGQGAPVRTASVGPVGWSRSPLPVTVPSAPGLLEAKHMLHDTDDQDTTDDLSLEMASLEGLMKDLNAITSEF
ncbi:neogenin-like isoform X2 [Lampetra fluviatilis]